MNEDQVRARRLKAFAAYDALERLPMPVIAVVHAAAVGSGCEIAAACDFVVATPEASFRTPEALWGTVGATQRLPRVLGKRLAKDLMFTGRALCGRRSAGAGLRGSRGASEGLEAVLAEIAKTIVARAADSMRLAKRCIDRGVELDPRGALATELLAIEENLAATTGGPGSRGSRARDELDATDAARVPGGERCGPRRRRRDRDRARAALVAGNSRRRRGARRRPCTRSACGAGITSACSWATTRNGSSSSTVRRSSAR